MISGGREGIGLYVAPIIIGGATSHLSRFLRNGSTLACCLGVGASYQKRSNEKAPSRRGIWQDNPTYLIALLLGVTR